MIEILNRIIEKLFKFKNLNKQQNELKILTGLSLLEKKKDINNINDNELKIFSQFGEDGIIDFLVKKINLQNKTFIEFGVEDYEESNTKFLLEAKNWRGLVFDSSQKFIDIIKKKDFYWRNNLIAVKAFITAENIDNLIKQNFLHEEVGLMSIDIDGNDYWVWKAIETYKPAIVIIEYNARFGYKKSVSIPYKKDFDRIAEHHSSIYFGASLMALYKLGKEKGYSLVGTNTNGNNSFFIRDDFLKKNENLKTYTPEQCFHINSFNELRDKNGNILDRNSNKEQEILNNLPLEKI
ncbi:hypothetical protein OAD13_04470 [Candidatus Pelagibacter sp.]|nr:hypothetical protein [Candidatus Pelagibacter sp.]